MAKFEIKYTVEMTKTIDWPDDELEFLTSDGDLLCNADVDESNEIYGSKEIIECKKDGKDFSF